MIKVSKSVGSLDFGDFEDIPLNSENEETKGSNLVGRMSNSSRSDHFGGMSNINAILRV